MGSKIRFACLWTAHDALFASRKRENLLNHIRRGRTPCKVQVPLRGPVLSELGADVIDDSPKPYYRDSPHKGLGSALEAPCVRVAGPLRARVVGPARIMQGGL